MARTGELKQVDPAMLRILNKADLFPAAATKVLLDYHIQYFDL